MTRRTSRSYQPPPEDWDQPPWSDDPGDDFAYSAEPESAWAEAGYAEDEYAPGEPPGLALTLSGGPGPGLIAVVTVVVCMILGLGLFAVSGPATAAMSAANEASAAIATQAAQLTAAPADQPAPAPTGPTAPADCTVSELFPAKVRRWCGLITQYAQKHNLAPDLVAALIWLESGGDEVAYSRSGAVGLMQVMPSDGLSAGFMCINGPCFSDRPTTAQLQDPEFNIAYGTRMLAGLVRKSGDLREALKSYGPMNAGYSYADKVLGLFQQYGK